MEMEDFMEFIGKVSRINLGSFVSSTTEAAYRQVARNILLDNWVVVGESLHHGKNVTDAQCAVVYPDVPFVPDWFLALFWTIVILFGICIIIRCDKKRIKRVRREAGQVVSYAATPTAPTMIRHQQNLHVHVDDAKISACGCFKKPVTTSEFTIILLTRGRTA